MVVVAVAVVVVVGNIVVVVVVVVGNIAVVVVCSGFGASSDTSQASSKGWKTTPVLLQ